METGLQLSPPPPTTWAGNSESVPQLCSKGLDAALSGDRADLPHPCVSPRPWLPAGSPPHHRGEWKASPGQRDRHSGPTGCVTSGKSVPLSGPPCRCPPRAEMRMGCERSQSSLWSPFLSATLTTGSDSNCACAQQPCGAGMGEWWCF